MQHRNLPTQRPEIIAPFDARVAPVFQFFFADFSACDRAVENEGPVPTLPQWILATKWNNTAFEVRPSSVRWAKKSR
jgi:hypothetical protein